VVDDKATRPKAITQQIRYCPQHYDGIIRGMGKRLKSFSDWVRRARNRPVMQPEAKLNAIRVAVLNSFPTSDLPQMLDEIEQGYRTDFLDLN
jgi:hypothetical protein